MQWDARTGAGEHLCLRAIGELMSSSTSTVAELNTHAFFSQVAWLGEETGLV